VPADARDRLLAVTRIPGAVLFTGAVLVLSTACVAVGTALDDGGASSGPQPLVARHDGSLRVNPRLLTLADVRKVPPGSPGRTLFELFFWAQWGSAPNIVAAYDPAVVRAVGVDDLTGAYALRRASLLASQPRITNTVSTSFGATVTVELLRRNEVPDRQSFTLRRIGGRWRVVYDTLLEDGIAAHVQGRETPASATAVPDAAAKAGIFAARRYRTAALHAIGLTPSQRP